MTNQRQDLDAEAKDRIVQLWEHFVRLKELQVESAIALRRAARIAKELYLDAVASFRCSYCGGGLPPDCVCQPVQAILRDGDEGEAAAVE